MEMIENINKKSVILPTPRTRLPVRTRCIEGNSAHIGCNAFLFIGDHAPREYRAMELIQLLDRSPRSSLENSLR